MIGAGPVGGAGVGSACVMGILRTGNLGCEVLTLNSPVCPERIWNPMGKIRLRVIILPGSLSCNDTFTPSRLMVGLVHLRSDLLLLRTVTALG